MKKWTSILLASSLLFTTVGATIPTNEVDAKSQTSAISEINNLKSYIIKGTAPGVTKLQVNMKKNQVEKKYSLKNPMPDEEDRGIIPYKIGQNLLYFNSNNRIQLISHELSKSLNYNDIKKIFGAAKLQTDSRFTYGFISYRIGKYTVNFTTYNNIRNISKAKFTSYSVYINGNYTVNDKKSFQSGTIKGLHGKIGMSRKNLVTYSNGKTTGFKVDGGKPSPPGVKGINTLYSKSFKNDSSEFYYVNSNTHKVTLVGYNVANAFLPTPNGQIYKTDNKYLGDNVLVYKVDNSPYYVSYDSERSELVIAKKNEILSFLGAKKLVK